MKKWMTRLWALDLRALAALRMAYGLIIILDLLIRATDLQAHYTDWGAIPRASVIEMSWFPSNISLHMMNGTWPFQALLFALAIVAGAALAVGYRTRLAAVVSYVMMASLHSRNPMIMDGGDNYIRVVLFWGLFLPWGARWSVDSHLRAAALPASDPTEEPAKTWFDLAALAYILQVGFVYFFSALLKTGPEWRIEGSATYYALMIDQLTTTRAAWLLPYPEVMKFLTFTVLYFEAFGPFLLLFPGPIRFLGAVAISLMHLGFGTFLHLGVFALIGISSPLGMWPGFAMDAVERSSLFAWLSRQGQRLARRFPPLVAPPESPAAPPHSEITRGFVGVVLASVVLWNITTLPGTTLPFPFPDWAVRLIRMDQSWNMFAPKPLIEDGWYVIEAKLVDGRMVDLYRNGAPISWDKPAHVASTFPNARWRKFMMNIWGRDYSKWRLPYGQYLTRQWNTTHSGGDQVETFKIYFVEEVTLPGGQTRPPERVVIWTHECFDKGPVPTPVGAPPTPTPSSTPTPTPSGAAHG